MPNPFLRAGVKGTAGAGASASVCYGIKIGVLCDRRDTRGRVSAGSFDPPSAFNRAHRGGHWSPT